MSLGVFIAVNNIPDPELGGADRVEVYERMGDSTLYSIFYPEDISEEDFSLLKEQRLDPNSILSILVPIDAIPECLVKGPVYSQQIHFENGGAGSSLEVRGGDNTLTMDREFKSTIWANVTDSEATIAILGSYGLIPNVTFTPARHLELKHSLVQRSTDLQFIRRLARRNGCLFWIDCNAIGLETAHFQRPQLDGQAAVDLIINRDNTNVQSFDLHWDVERPTSVVGKQLDLSNKSILDGDLSRSPQSDLATQHLQSITGDTRSTHVTAPSDDAGNVRARSEGALIEADWFVQLKCQTSVKQLGQLVRANTIANVVGIGSRHSGKYLVESVRHIIDATGHTMEVELIRNAWNV